MSDLQQHNLDYSDAFNESIKRISKLQEEFWNSLTKEQQLDVFCCVVRRLVKGELEEQGSYRHVLYDTFGFGYEAYGLAQCAGFIDLHNSIYSVDYEKKLLKEFCNAMKIDQSMVDKFYKGELNAES